MFLSLVFHNHQPIGQLPWAFEDAWRDSYQPFLEVLERHPTIKVGLHYTGPLLEWLEANRPETIALARRLVERGQVEMLGGGLYEPILAIWPEADQHAQIAGLSQRVRELFGVKPRGLWLAERVWEPQLAPVIAGANIDYTLVDSSVFAAAGLDEATLFGYFQAPAIDSTGRAPFIFPINYELRQLIPWREPEAILEYLRPVADMNEDALAVFADDGEKFGGWPGTFELIFERGWLDRFFTVLEENENWLKTVTLSSYLDRYTPLGTVDLPAGSYAEMQQWSGGNWRNFLTSYSESADMWNEVMRVRDQIFDPAFGIEPDEAERQKAYDCVLRAQSNDAYWHGVFGGLYLSHLRQAVYSQATAAETIARSGSIDHHIDIHPEGEIVMQNEQQKLLFNPTGGAIALWSSKIVHHNLLATLQRRHEPYHEGELPNDWYPRTALLDHFFGADVTPESFANASFSEQGDFITEEWRLEDLPLPDSVTAARDGGVWIDGTFQPLNVTKQVSLPADSDRMQVEYTFTSRASEPIELWWGNEWNVVLSGSQLPERHYHAQDHGDKLDLREPAQFEAVTNPIVADRWLGLWVEWKFPDPVALWHVPLFTVSQKEGGEIERTYQQSAFVFHRKLRLEPGVPMVVAFEAVLTAHR